MANEWKYHDSKMKELKKKYTKINKTTQNRLQEVMNRFNITSDNLYNIASPKDKDAINHYIEEWKSKGYLSGEFGRKANDVYRRSRVTYYEILELLIHQVYIEQEEEEKNEEYLLFLALFGFYYEEGQKEVINAERQNGINKKHKMHKFTDDLLLSLLAIPNVLGYTYEQYKNGITDYNSEQILRQAVINIQQQKPLEISSDEFQRVINKQQNAKVSINNNKISGAIDNTCIGMNNLAKQMGMEKQAPDVKVRFVAVEDDRTTPMCRSLDGQIFSVNGINEFKRYSDLHEGITKYRCKGLVSGLNLPPISDHFHYCRSTIQYSFTMNEPITKKKITKITDRTIDNLPLVEIEGYTREQCERIQELHKDLLRHSKNDNDNKEVMYIVDNKGNIINTFDGDADTIDITIPYSYNSFIMHNHPRNVSYSVRDINVFLYNDGVKSLSIVKNNGKIEVITKNDKYDNNKALQEFRRSCNECIKKYKKNPPDEELDKVVSRFLDKENGIIWKK